MHAPKKFKDGCDLDDKSPTCIVRHTVLSPKEIRELVRGCEFICCAWCFRYRSVSPPPSVEPTGLEGSKYKAYDKFIMDRGCEVRALMIDGSKSDYKCPHVYGDYKFVQSLALASAADG